MDVHKIPAIVNEIANEELLPVPEKVILSKHMSRTWGTCNRDTMTIKLNYRFCSENSEEVVRDLIRHELAHFLEPGHGEEFLDLCNDLGIMRHTRQKHINAKTVGRYQYLCPGCGKIIRRDKKIKSNAACGECCNGAWDEKYRLIDVSE